MPKKRPSAKRPTMESVLRAVWLEAAIPVTPEEVAIHDARHRNEPRPAIQPPAESLPFFSWERKKAPPAADNIIAFRTDRAAVPLAYAARAPRAVSPQTHAKLAQLVDEMRREKKE